jgi:hypothetical protein
MVVVVVVVAVVAVVIIMEVHTFDVLVIMKVKSKIFPLGESLR